MKLWLLGKTITDEYGAKWTNEDFWKMVDSKQKKGNLNHAVEMKKDYPTRIDDFLVGNYSFSDSEFS